MGRHLQPAWVLTFIGLSIVPAAFKFAPVVSEPRLGSNWSWVMGCSPGWPRLMHWVVSSDQFSTTVWSGNETDLASWPAVEARADRTLSLDRLSRSVYLLAPSICMGCLYVVRCWWLVRLGISGGRGELALLYEGSARATREGCHPR